MARLGACVQQGEILKGGFPGGCLRELRQHVAESRAAEDHVRSARSRMQELGQCLTETEIMKDDTSHVSFRCMKEMERCMKEAIAGSDPALIARVHLTELARFIDDSGAL